MIDLTITELLYGWVDLNIVMDTQSLMCCSERTPNDALSDILLSAIRITGSGIDTKIVFPNGLYKTEMSIETVDETRCRISYEDTSLTTPTKQFVRAVIRMFDKYVFEYSIEAYAANWRAFPSEDLTRLRTKYHTL